MAISRRLLVYEWALRTRPRWSIGLASIVGLFFVVSAGLFSDVASAFTPDSPEVRKLISAGLGFLEDNADERLGGKCVIAMAFLKAADAPNHPRVHEAIQACQEAAHAANATNYSYDVYSNGLAIIFLCEVDPRKYRKEIDGFLRVLYARQKPHGGWGYDYKTTGDTSQTQYGILASWEAHRVGIPVEGERVHRALYWLLRTQDPSGVWGYQGNDSKNPDDFTLRKQKRTSVSMLAAGLGSVLMCSHILGIEGIKIKEPEEFEPQLDLPSSVTRVEIEKTKTAAPVSGKKPADRDRIAETIARANKWMNQNWTVKSQTYGCYYLYSVERYRSFQELLDGKFEEEPAWYNEGVERLKVMQRENGSWSNGAGQGVDTAFSILFLIRSMKMSIGKDGLGGGTLVGGRGLPQNTAAAQVRRGQLFDPKAKKQLGDLIQILEDPDHPDHARYLSNPRSLDIADGKPQEQDVVRLQRLIRGGEPEIRLVAVRMLARRRSLDDVPALLFAMTDPDRPVVLAARDGLRFISRRFDGYGLPDNYTDRARYDVIEEWKEWYGTVRPDAATAF